MTGGSWRVNVWLEMVGLKDLSTADITIPVSSRDTQTQSLAFGTGDASFTTTVVVSQGLPPGASHTLDMYDGSLTDIYGDAAELRELRAFAFWVESGGDSSGVTLTGGASNPHTLFWTGTTPGQTVYPSGPPALGGGTAVVSVTSTARTLKLTNNGAVDVTYKLVLVGSLTVSGAAMGVLGLTYP